MNPRIQAYIDIVESGEIPMCREQLLLIERVKAAFENEKIHVDDEQLERYMGLQKYFEYKLLPWEEFVFALHNCTYTERLRRLRLQAMRPRVRRKPRTRRRR